MRAPKIENYSNTRKYETVEVKGFGQCSNSVVLMNEKDKVKFIKKCEMVIRSSSEYREYVKYLKEYIDMTQCSFFTNINSEASNKIKIEIHHEPFSLFDITNIVVNKAIMNGDDLNYFMIAEEVMKLHYQGRVGLIPLSLTVHELFHNGKIFIPLQSVRGDFLSFVEEYEDYIPSDYIEILVSKIKASKEIKDAGYQDLTILNKKYVYLEVDGMTFPNLVESK